MAGLGDKMVTALFGQSEAEKTFRPWWDTLEDFLVYGLILLGKSMGFGIYYLRMLASPR